MMNQIDTHEHKVELSVISPVYMGASMVAELVSQIKASLDLGGVASYEIILVEDGSPDESWQAIQSACAKHDEVVGVRLTRNFGQHPAISAGLRCAKGDFVVVIDCDLQDDPKYIPDILNLLRGGASIVLGRKAARRHSLFKNVTASLFNYALNYLTDHGSVFGDGRVGAFSGLNRRVVDEFNNMKDVHRHYLMIVRWLGFPITYIDVHHRPRLEGKSSYTFSKLLIHAIDGITSQSTKLLRMFVMAGFVMCVLALLALTLVVAMYFVQGFREGWASLLCVMLLSTGLVLSSLGIVGIYIGQILEQVRERPLFIIDRIIGRNE